MGSHTPEQAQAIVGLVLDEGATPADAVEEAATHGVGELPAFQMRASTAALLVHAERGRLSADEPPQRSMVARLALMLETDIERLHALEEALDPHDQEGLRDWRVQYGRVSKNAASVMRLMDDVDLLPLDIDDEAVPTSSDFMQRLEMAHSAPQTNGHQAP